MLKVATSAKERAKRHQELLTLKLETLKDDNGAFEHLAAALLASSRASRPIARSWASWRGRLSAGNVWPRPSSRPPRARPTRPRGSAAHRSGRRSIETR
jgi:hypothetical protein